MKLKCPGCAKILQVPDSAAGKVVKCQCGKQLRVPGGVPAAAASRPAARTASGQSRTGQSPAGQSSPRRPAGGQGGFGDFDPGLFDELTDSDFGSPAAAPAASGGGTLMKQYAPPDEVGDSEPPSGKRRRRTLLVIVLVVGTLIFVGLGLTFGGKFLG